MKSIIEKNQYGETIEIKVEKDDIMVKHSDISDEFMTLGKLFKDFILSLDEVIIIYNACKELNMMELGQTPSEHVKKFFKLG